MSLREWISDGWSWFFGLVAIAIFVTLTAPALFGFQNYAQWGGMFDDHWCFADVYSGNPYLVPSPKHQWFTAEGKNQARVYSAPMHNRLTCTAWVRTLCGKKANDGWTILWVKPKLQGVHFLGEQNACQIELPETEHWYFHAQS